MPILIVFALIAVIVAVFLGRAKEQQMLTVYEGNLKQLPVEIKLGHYQDTQCGMPVEQLGDSCQVSAPDGKTWFFDDVGCMALWIENKSFIDEAKIWVYSRDTDGWIDARTAWYSLTDNTPMRYGFGAYSTRQEGFIDFETMKLKMLRGENMTDPYVRRELLGNH
ncbi:MAG: hypothetical protein U9Q62_04845 [Campylobacterota bacterium]|nr:hypothetical protein [Campylobacterota bacterium]